MATDAPSSSSLLRPLAADLAARREQVKLGGGAEKIAVQHAADKLTARERIALLIDEGRSSSSGSMAGRTASPPWMGARRRPTA